MLTHALRRLREEPRPLRFLASRLLWHSGACRALSMRRVGYRLRFFPTALSATLWLYPEERAEDEQLIRALLQPGDHYVDVGANIGHLALCAAAQVGPQGQVVAFEAHPRTHHFLSGNLAINPFGWARAVHSALGEQAGTLHFSDMRSDDQNRVLASGGVSVPVARLDDFDLGPLALLKIDVEGFEGPVLQGARATLQRTQAVLFESWDQHLAHFGWTPARLIALLAEAGFTVFMPEANRLQPVAADHTSPRCENLLALRDAAAFCQRNGWRIAGPEQARA